MTTVRKCSTCKHYEPAPIWRKGWCRNPHLYSPQQSHLVGEEDLDCDRGMGNYWEPLDASGADGTKPRNPEPVAEETFDAPQPVMKKASADIAQPIMMNASRPSPPPDRQGAGGGGSRRSGGAGRSGGDNGGDAGSSGGWRGGDTGPFSGSGGGDTGPFDERGDSGRGGGLGRFTKGGKSGGGGGLSRFTGGGKLGGGGFSRFSGGGGSGGRGGGNNDDDGNPFTPPPREPRRPAGTPERQFTYYTEQRYWTDYLRIAAPVLGVILILGLVWFWLGSLMGGGEATPSPSPSPSIAGAASSSPQSQSPLIIADTASPTPPASSPRVVATPDASETANADTFVFARGDKAVVGNTDGDGANLRSEPDSNSEIVTVLDDGTKLDITGDSIQKGPLTWWPITTPDGDEGYIAEDLLKPFNSNE